jgi:hypothetical protein
MVVEKASGRVPERASGPSRSRVDDSGGLQYVSRKIDRILRFFPSRGIYRRKGGGRRWTRRPHPLVARPGPGPRHPRVWLAPGPPPSHLRTSRRFEKNRRFDFCFVQFREYLLCSISETQKQQKQGTGTVASHSLIQSSSLVFC